MIESRKTFFYCSTALLSLALFATGASAQDAGDVEAVESASVPAAPEAQVPVAYQGGLDEIVVTARKREESIQDIPVAVSAFSQAQLDRGDLTSIEKIASMTPQLSVGRASSGSGAQLSMRGIGSASTSIGIEQSVAVIVDGAYSGQGRVINEGFFDLERAEILKGPQALFFGKNATAGVVSLTTANPTDYFYGKARVGYEFTADQLIGEGVLSGPITDNLGLRFAVRASEMWGGYYKNKSGPLPYTTTDVATGVSSTFIADPVSKNQPQEKDIIARLTAEWQPTDRLNINVKGTYSRNKVNNNSWNYVAFGCATGYSTVDPTQRCRDDVFESQQNRLPEEVARETKYAKDSGALFNDYEAWGVTGQIEYDLDTVLFTSVTNYSENNNTWACSCAYQSIGVFATEDTNWRSFSNETRLLTQFDGPVNLMFGAFYSNTKRDLDQNVIFAGAENSNAPKGLRYVAYSKDSETKGETISPFGQVMWDVTDKLNLTAGVRYTHETKDSYFLQPYVNPVFVGSFVGGDVIAADQTFTNWSPEATISYAFTPDINLYAAYKTGYKSGGLSNSGIYSALSTTPEEDFLFEPEKAKGFEVGLKTMLFDRQLRFNVTAYRYEFSNLQVDYFNAPTFAYLTINAGSAVTKGVETEFQYAPVSVPGFEIHGSVNYNDASYKDFLSPCWAGQTVAQGCPLPTGPGGFPLQDLSGHATAMAPEWTGTLGAYYEGNLNDSTTFGLGADARFSDSYFASGFGNPLSKVDAYFTLDASARVGFDNGRYELAIIGKNLTNHQYFLGAHSDGPTTGTGTGTPAGISADQIGFGAVPRTVTVQATYEF